MEGAVCDNCGNVIGPYGCCTRQLDMFDRVKVLEAKLCSHRDAIVTALAWLGHGVPTNNKARAIAILETLLADKYLKP